MNAYKHLLAALWTATLLVGCGYTHDPAALFPQDYPATYTAVTQCQTGTAHTPRSYVVWASPGADQRWLAGDPFEPDDVLLRVQFDNAECDGPAVCTVMKKLPEGAQPAGGDWTYQIVDGNGELTVNGQWQDCIDCHSNCTNYSCAGPAQ